MKYVPAFGHFASLLLRGRLKDQLDALQKQEIDDSEDGANIRTETKHNLGIGTNLFPRRPLYLLEFSITVLEKLNYLFISAALLA